MAMTSDECLFSFRVWTKVEEVKFKMLELFPCFPFLCINQCASGRIGTPHNDNDHNAET